MNRLSVEEEKFISLVDVAALEIFLREMVGCNSENPPGCEDAIAKLLVAKLESLGLQVELQYVEPNRPNVIALLPGMSEEQLLFNGHMDTVPIGLEENWTMNPFGGEVHEGRLYGRGACDMKSGLAAMIFGLEALIKSGLPRQKSILLTAVIDEEVYFKGTSALIKEHKLDLCTRAYVSEPTSVGVASALQGGAEFFAEVYGKASHSGMAELGENAIFYMNKFINVLEIYRQKLIGKGIKLGFCVDPSLNLGIISGGSGIILVPDYCRIEFDRQVLPGENMVEIIAEIKKLFEDTCIGYNFKGSIKCNQYFNCWQVDKNSEVVDVLRRCHQGVTSQKPEDILFRGYCEVEMLNNIGIPGVVYGPGSILQAHRPDEYVSLREVEIAAKTYALVAKDFVK